MDSDTLKREARRIRSQMARPLDDGWEQRYLRTSATGHTTGDTSAVMVVQAPDAPTRSEVRAALRETTLSGLFERPRKGHGREAVVHITTNPPPTQQV